METAQLTETTGEPEVITALDENFIREFKDEIAGTIPYEKVAAHLRQAKIARVMKAAGSVAVPELGQKIAEIDARLYFRLRQEFGHEENWLNDFLADNPILCAPGWKPKQNGLRHGHTFVDGKPISVTKGRVQS